MRRAFHLLQPNKTIHFPKRFIFLDTETYRKEMQNGEEWHTLRLGYALFWQRAYPEHREKTEWCYFTTKEKFWKFVYEKLTKDKPLWVIAHNLPFDFRIVDGFNEMVKQKFEPTALIINEPTHIWKFKRGKHYLLFVDNLNYFMVGIGKLGEQLGLPKLKTPDESAPLKIWKTYCKRDVEILFRNWQNWLNFINQNNFGTFAKTLASQAFNAFRHRFYSHNIYIHDNKEVIQLERESYRGGRTECFFIGKPKGRKFYFLDVNSMYPFVMKNYQYPRKLLGLKENVPISVLKNLLKKYCVCAKVLLKLQKPIVGKKEENKLIFPVGKFVATLTTEELKQVLKEGEILEVRKLSYYLKGALFKKYITTLYQLRLKFSKEGNKVYRYLCKLLMNSLYGKFGQLNKVFKKVWYEPERPPTCYIEKLPNSNKEYIVRYIAGWRWEEVGKEEGYNSFPAIAAEVTANARLTLFKYIEKAGTSNVFYCDTDGLIINEYGFNNLKDFVSKDKLGMLKLEEIAKFLDIRGLKDYTFGDFVKQKGIKKDAVEVAPRVYIQNHFEGLKGALHKGRLNKVVVIKVKKVMKDEYLKGWVLQDGRVLPFELNDPHFVKPNFIPKNYDAVKKEFNLIENGKYLTPAHLSLPDSLNKKAKETKT
jgi:hypothetical protein